MGARGFAELFSPEWDAERTELNEGMYEGADGPADDEVLRFELARRGFMQHDPEKLRQAIDALVVRVRAAHALLPNGAHAMLPGSMPIAERDAVGEVLSDCGLLLMHFSDLLAARGPRDSYKIELVKRRRGPREDSATIRRGFRIGAAAQALLDVGEKRNGGEADGVIAEKLNLPDDYVRKWRLRRAAAVRAMEKADAWSANSRK